MITISNNINFGLSLAQSATQERIERAIERLSTGKRINKAKDDVSGLQISSRLEVEITANRKSTENAKYIQNTLDTANEAASNTQSQLLKLRELAVRSANGTLSAKDIEHINQEADQIIKSIDKTASSTSFAGVKLLDGTFTNKNFAVTNSQNGSISIAFDNLSHEALGLKNLDLSKHISKTEYTGTNGKDTLIGKIGIDLFTGKAGHDNIDGREGNDVSIFEESHANFDIFKGAFTTLNVMGSHSQNIEIGFEIIDTDGAIYRVSYSPSNTATQDVAQQLANASIKDISGNTVTNPGFTLSKGADASVYIRKENGEDFSIRPWGGVNQGSINAVAQSSSNDSSSSGYYDVAMSDEGKRSVAWSTTVPSGGQGKILLQRYDVSGNTDGNVLTIKASGEVHRPSITYLENNHLALTFFEFNSTTGTRDTHLNIIDDYGFVVHSSVVNEGAVAGDYINPEVTDLGNSEFMVQWTYNQNHPQTLATGSYAQLYNYEGTKKGMAFTVSDTNSGSAAINRALKIDNSKFIMPTIKNSNDLAFQIYDKNVQAHVLQGNEFQLNSYSNGNQSNVNSTPLSNGEFVSVWTSSGQDGSGNGVFAQKFSGLGTKIGSEFRVNSHTADDQKHAIATTLSNGDFLVTWASNNQVENNSGYDLYAQRYDSNANKIGSVFLVNKATDGDQGYLTSSSNFTGHSVTPLDNDGFTITWESQDGISNRVFSQIFDANNQKVLMHDINEDKKVNTFTIGDQSNSDVVTLSNGNYVVTWHSLNQNGYRSQAMGQIFSSIGDKIGSEFKIDPDSGASDFAAWYTSISATQNGGFAVTWESDGQDGSSAGIFLQRFDQSGSKVGGAIQVNSHSAGNQFRPKITELTNGNIVVSWSSFETPNNYPGKNNSNDVSIIANHDNASHDYFVQFTDDTSSGMVRPYTAGGGVDPTLDPNSKIEIMGREYTVSQGTVTAKTTSLQTQLANDGITSTIRNVGSPWGTYLEIEETSIADYIEAYGTSKFNFYGNPLDNTDGSSNDHDLLTNALPTLVSGYNKSNDIFIQRFDSAGNSLGSQTRVNSVINGNQDISAITGLDGGNFVVAWQTENEDGDGNSIAAQLYDSSGQKVGSAIHVNTTTAGLQKNPDIAKLADGNFVITWEEVNTSAGDYGIYGQIFNSSGNKVGAQFRIDDQTNEIGNSYVGQIESNSKVLGLSSGKFIVLYQRHDGKTGDLDTSGIGLYGQLFNADGTTAGEFPKFGKIFVNRSRKDGNQELANISESPEGNIIVTFTSSPTDGSKDIYTLFLTPDGMNLAEMEQTMGLYAGLNQSHPTLVSYGEDGYLYLERNAYVRGETLIGLEHYDKHMKRAAHTGNERINNQSLEDVLFPQITKLTNGNIVVSWFDNPTNGNSTGMFLRVLDRMGGTGYGSPYIQVNTTTNGTQANGRVTALSNGGFLAVWESQSGQDGDGSGIYGQFFNSDGSKSGVEFQINSFNSGDQKLASAIELSNGNIIVSWTSDGQDGSGTGVFAKILAPHKVTLKGVKDNFSDSNGSENVSISTGLQAHINSTFPSSSTVPFDNNATNSIRGVSFDLSDKKDGILSAMLRIKAKPIDDEKGEGNDEILLSGFAADGTPLMTTYKIGLGIDSQPNNFFPFDWQVDDRPTVNPNGYDIIIDLAKFISKEGTNTSLSSSNMLSELNTHGILDIIVSDDSNVDFIELEINGQIYDVKTTKTVETSLSSELVGEAVLSKSSQGFTVTWVEGINKELYAQHFDSNGNSLVSKKLLVSNVNDATSLVSTDSAGNEYLDILWGSGLTGDKNTYFRRYNLSDLSEVAAHKTEVFADKNYYIKGILDKDKKVLAFENADTNSSINFKSLDQVAMDKNTKFGFEGRIFDGYNELLETKSISGNTNGNKDIVVVGKEHGNGTHSGTELYDIDRHKNIEWLKFSDGYYDTQNDIFHANPFVPDLGEVPEPIPTIDAAIEKVNTFMGKNGALGNAVERIISNNINTLFSIKKAKSSITDANIALESAELAKHNLLLSSQSKFGQIINASKNTILGLIAKDTLVYKEPFSYS